MDEDHLTIYVRNTFRVKWNCGSRFLEGKKNFIKETKGKWSLVAAFSEWPLLRNGHLVEREVEAIQIWKVNDWDVLYNTMKDFSEREWYRKLGSSLASESHDLLINATSRSPEPHIHWKKASYPGYSYVYELSRPRERKSHAYLRESYWFNAQMAAARQRWELVWCASQITSQPAELAFLWRVPNPKGFDGERVPRELGELVRDVSRHDRYDHMMGLLQTTKRQILYPIYTERLAELEASSVP